jgi:hypothetical protein
MTVVGEGVSSLTISNTILGDVNANQIQAIATGSALQARSLHTGWNLMAFCVNTAGLTVPQAMESVTGEYSRILGEEGSYVVGLPDSFQSLHGMYPPGGYWVRVEDSNPVTLTQIAPSYPYTTPIPMSIGWHWIGYCSPTPQAVPDALASMAGKYDRVLGENGSYVVGLPDTFQSLHEMSQGNGYMIHVTSAGTLQYPQRAGEAVGKGRSPEARGSHTGCPPLWRTPWMTLVYGEVKVNGKPAPVGTVVEAITGDGTVAGCGVVKDAGKLGLTQVYGGSENDPGFAEGETIRWRVNGTEANASITLTWSNDRDAHELTLSVPIGGGGGMSMFLPLVGK